MGRHGRDGRDLGDRRESDLGDRRDGTAIKESRSSGEFLASQ